MSEQAKFAPGPWKVEELSPSDKRSFRFGYDLAVETVADDGDYICCLDCDETTQLATAQLIAAAPELYEALKAAQETIREWQTGNGDHGTSNATLCQVDAALMKAEGRTHD